MTQSRTTYGERLGEVKMLSEKLGARTFETILSTAQKGPPDETIKIHRM